MDVKVLGAARQVGRSAFLVSHKETSILLDYGALTTKVPGFPMHVQPKQVRAIVLSHAHLDHSGAAPIYFLGGKVKLHSTPVTAELSSLLIQDFIKISGQYLPFEFIDLMSMNNSTVSHGYLEPFQIGDLTLEFFDAGHIPGSCIPSGEGGSKRLLYPGDINGNETNLLKPSWKSIGEADMVITESTYATADHPERSAVEKEFVDFANAVIERGGVLLVPAFSVGRAQEIAMVLYNHGFKHPVSMDGMALKVNEILLRYQEYLKEPTLLRRTLESTEQLVSWSQRRRVVKRPSVIFFFQAEDGIRDLTVTGVQTCALPIFGAPGARGRGIHAGDRGSGGRREAGPAARRPSASGPKAATARVPRPARLFRSSRTRGRPGAVGTVTRVWLKD